MNLPANLGELTVEQFQGLTKLYNSDKDPLDVGVEAVSLLSGKSVEYLSKDVDYKDLAKCFNHVKTLISARSVNDLEQTTKFNPTIVVSGRIFKACMASDFNSAQFKACQYIDAKNLSKNWVDNLHLLLCAVWLPVNVFGKRKKYNGSKIEGQSKIMLKAKLKDVCGLLFFYSAVFEKLNPIIQMSLGEATKTIQDQMEEIMNNSEFLASVGHGGTKYTN